MEYKSIGKSFGDIVRISFPMILSMLSSNLMYFVDRAILAGYSLDAMYASVVSGGFYAIFAWIFVGVASTAEVFVSQSNGQKNYDKLAGPVWQMIYMSAMSAVLFLPLGYFSEYINFLPDYAREEGIAYQRPLLYFGFLPGLISGISAFFIGQGKTGIVMYITIIGNACNAILSYYAVYNLGMGAAGAAIATVISEVLQVVILASVFLNESNRRLFNTIKNRHFDKKMFCNCFKIGTPLSINNLLVVLAWQVIATLAGHTSSEIGIIWGIGVSIHVLISFVAEGLSKATSTITANMIGKGDIGSVKKVFKNFMGLIVVFICLFSVPMVLLPDLTFSILNIPKEEISRLREQLTIILRFDFALFILESLEYVTWGILMAGGDTKYPTIVSQSCVWGSVVLPVCVMYFLGKLSSVNAIYCFLLFSCAVSSFLMFRRYKSLKWCRVLV
jgi:MATE family multidrug resistance protein